MKDKIVKWQAVNGTQNWINSLTEIWDVINNQIQKSLFTSIISLQLMFLWKPKFFIFILEKKRQVLQQIYIKDINNFCKEAKYM